MNEINFLFNTIKTKQSVIERGAQRIKGFLLPFRVWKMKNLCDLSKTIIHQTLCWSAPSQFWCSLFSSLLQERTWNNYFFFRLRLSIATAIFVVGLKKHYVLAKIIRETRPRRLSFDSLFLAIQLRPVITVTIKTLTNDPLIPVTLPVSKPHRKEKRKTNSDLPPRWDLFATEKSTKKWTRFFVSLLTWTNETSITWTTSPVQGFCWTSEN